MTNCFVVSSGSTRSEEARFHRIKSPPNTLRTSKMQVERIWEFLRRLNPSTQSCLLAELERLELCGIDMPGSADIRARLRAELRKDESTEGSASPSSYFFAPLE